MAQIFVVLFRGGWSSRDLYIIIYYILLYMILSRFIYLRGWCLFGTDWGINHRWGSIFLLFEKSALWTNHFQLQTYCNACWQTEGKHSQLSLSNAQGFQDLKYGPITRTNRGQLTNDKIVICVRQFVQALDHPPGGKWQHLSLIHIWRCRRRG